MKENSGAHEWLIEFEREPNNFDFFVDVLDKYLKEQNSDYEAKRYNNYVLHAPKINKMKSGSFLTWLKKHNKMGGQFKIPRLSNNRHLVEEILNLQNH